MQLRWPGARSGALSGTARLCCVAPAVACVALLLSAAAKRYRRQARLLDLSAASSFGASYAL
ncbi:hypothetical protein T492DRAFT_884360 [Pavlovales sp. CCMP2436]|nr:hypothetical protein T492DRAFT_884360 [Pavlovales sp. CCMP2436]